MFTNGCNGMFPFPNAVNPVTFAPLAVQENVVNKTFDVKFTATVFEPEHMVCGISVFTFGIGFTNTV